MIWFKKLKLNLNWTLISIAINQLILGRIKKVHSGMFQSVLKLMPTINKFIFSLT